MTNDPLGEMNSMMGYSQSQIQDEIDEIAKTLIRIHDNGMACIAITDDEERGWDHKEDSLRIIARLTVHNTIQNDLLPTIEARSYIILNSMRTHILSIAEATGNAEWMIKNLDDVLRFETEGMFDEEEQ